MIGLLVLVVLAGYIAYRMTGAIDDLAHVAEPERQPSGSCLGDLVLAAIVVAALLGLVGLGPLMAGL